MVERILRRPRTTQERKANCTRNFLEFYGYKVKVRAKRNKINLPNAWDDVHIRKQKSWKKLRRKQYKEPAKFKLRICKMAVVNRGILETPRFHPKSHVIDTMIGCPRCSKCHSQTIIHAFVNGGIDEGFNFWYECPVLKEPVLVKIHDFGELTMSIVQK